MSTMKDKEVKNVLSTKSECTTFSVSTRFNLSFRVKKVI